MANGCKKNPSYEEGQEWKRNMRKAEIVGLLHTIIALTLAIELMLSFGPQTVAH